MNRWRTISVAGLALALVSAAPAAAQRPARTVGQWRAVMDPTAGWHAFGPVMLSITAVAGFGTGDLAYPEPGSQFLLLAAEPGIRGGRASLVYSRWMGFQGGIIARGSVLRFWSDDPGRIWMGGELQWVISVLPLGVRVGAFRPTNEDAGPGKTLWLADLSVMY
jgi:hypothetical protein